MCEVREGGKEEDRGMRGEEGRGGEWRGGRDTRNSGGRKREYRK